MKYFLLIGYFLTIPLANWMIGNIGECIPNGPCVIPVGFGLFAPSGVLMIGLALLLRDMLHEYFGWQALLLAVIVGSGLSLGFSSPSLAIASAIAFAVAELADMLVYAPLRKRNLPVAVVASGAVGAVVDSLLFVWIAFGSTDFTVGTTVAKIYASVLFFALVRRK